MVTAKELFEYTELVRKKSPLVHCITNQVAFLLACGASPAMVLAPEQVEEFVGVADALSINLGTLNADQRKAIQLATDAANKRRIPWVLDPVGIGLSWTREFAFELLEKKPTVIRGNASEIITLAGGDGKARGVNSTQTSMDALPFAKKLSQNGSIICVTGEEDLIVSQHQILRIKNGHPLMEKVTALGCSLSAVVSSYLSVATNETEQQMSSTAALAHISLAGELASKVYDKPGSFAVAFLDKLYDLDLKDYEKYLQIDELK